MYYAEHPVIIGHRGSGRTSDAPDGLRENTSASVQRAISDGADGVEIDVQLSADDVLVVYHNHSLPSGKRVRETPYAELAGLGVETFAAIAESASQAKVLNVEVKTGYTDPAEKPDPRITGAILEDAYTWSSAFAHQVVISSFDPDVIRSFHAERPDLKKALLTAPYDWHTDTETPLIASVSWARTIGADALHANVEQLRIDNASDVAEDIRNVHSAELGLMVWCPNPQQAASLLKMGADGVCVDAVPQTVAETRRLRK